MTAYWNDKFGLLRSVELLMANPKHIRRQALAILARVEETHAGTLEQEAIIKLAADKIIAHYSNLTAFTGGATALTGVVPGMGTLVALIGGAATDTALCLKFQVEMTMALATIHGHDILENEAQVGCKLITGLGLVTEQAKQGGKVVGTTLFVNLVRRYLKGSTLLITKGIFKRIGLTFTRTAFVKAIPLGVGVLVGAGGNKLITTLIGKQVYQYFCVTDLGSSADISKGSGFSKPAASPVDVVDVDFTPLDESSS